MYYYQVIPSIKLPYRTLTYCSDNLYLRGQVILIPIKNKQQYGVIDSVEVNASYEESKIKHIVRAEPFLINDMQMSFLAMFSYNSFNKIGLCASLLIQPFKLLTLKDKKELIENKTAYPSSTNKKISQKNEVQYELDKDISFRISYIIRTIIEVKKNPSITLFLFPEFKSLHQIYNEIIKLVPEAKQYIKQYSGNKDSKSKQTVKSLLSTNEECIIVFGLRSGLFLPFPFLTGIYCVDEGSPYYIQEQQSVYYDVRDTAFLLMRAYESRLMFLSTLPSIRLQGLYQESRSAPIEYTHTNDSKKPLKINVTNLQSHFSKNHLFSQDLSLFLDDYLSDESSQYYSIDENDTDS